MFVKIRCSWFPVDVIDQIDEVGEKVMVSLQTGQKIQLDAIEGEKVLKQIRRTESVDVAMQAMLNRLTAAEGQIMAMKAAAISSKAKVKTSA